MSEEEWKKLKLEFLKNAYKEYENEMREIIVELIPSSHLEWLGL